MSGLRSFFVHLGNHVQDTPVLLGPEAWDSSMPAWEQFLSEEQMWELVLALYHDTGQRPWAVEAAAHE